MVLKWINVSLCTNKASRFFHFDVFYSIWVQSGPIKQIELWSSINSCIKHPLWPQMESLLSMPDALITHCARPVCRDRERERGSLHPPNAADLSSDSKQLIVDCVCVPVMTAGRLCTLSGLLSLMQNAARYCGSTSLRFFVSDVITVWQSHSASCERFFSRLSPGNRTKTLSFVVVLEPPQVFWYSWV